MKELNLILIMGVLTVISSVGAETDKKAEYEAKFGKRIADPAHSSGVPKQAGALQTRRVSQEIRFKQIMQQITSENAGASKSVRDRFGRNENRLRAFKVQRRSYSRDKLMSFARKVDPDISADVKVRDSITFIGSKDARLGNDARDGSVFYSRPVNTRRNLAVSEREWYLDKARHVLAALTEESSGDFALQGGSIQVVTAKDHKGVVGRGFRFCRMVGETPVRGNETFVSVYLDWEGEVGHVRGKNPKLREATIPATTVRTKSAIEKEIQAHADRLLVAPADGSLDLVSCRDGEYVFTPVRHSSGTYLVPGISVTTELAFSTGKKVKEKWNIPLVDSSKLSFE